MNRIRILVYAAVGWLVVKIARRRAVGHLRSRRD
jgi:hypothetical protein